MLYGRLVHVGETSRFADFGFELHKNAFGGRAPNHGSATGAGLLKFIVRY